MFEWLNGWITPSQKKDLKDMTKVELEKKGREVGIELDRRRKKATLVKQLRKKLGE